MSLKVFESDPHLRTAERQILDRVAAYRKWKADLEEKEGGLAAFAEGYKLFGFNRSKDGYTHREWLPNAKQVFLVGDFNGWKNTTPLAAESFGRWAVHLPDGPDGAPAIPHRSQLKIRLETNDGQWFDRVPAWAKLAWQDKGTNLYNGVCWEPPPDQLYQFKHPRPPRPGALKIYEAHVGMSSKDPKVSTYLEFARDVLPRIKRLGYNAVQLMAVAEHAHYGCFGYHVTNFFAPASRSGTPEELKELIDRAHGLGLTVLMDLVHAHCSSNTLDGIAMMDGTDYCYTHGGPKGHQEQWDSKLFHYTKYEVLRFLLSNVKWWLEEYQFDGFRFDGVTSMLYHSHGIGKCFAGGYDDYFGPDADVDSHVYLMLANELIHATVPSAWTIGEDVSGMPTLCLPVGDGGFGFDYRLAMAIPDMLVKLVKDVPDDAWDMGHIVHSLTNRRWGEKCIAYAESHDQCIVGDKTQSFLLMDKEMYTGMSLVETPVPSLVVDRGLALHKVIRLMVLGLGGEGYLNFMGNEFGHPEWVDFPRPENGWSYEKCVRRWDLADNEQLRYKFFEKFDELMQACEDRFAWLAAEHQYVSVKDEADKIIAFERGDLLFVANFHPSRSFEGYNIGMSWNEPMRTILDTDEKRFGGQQRLAHGHANPFPPQQSAHGRPHSVKMYLPSRTMQVLVKDSLLEGSIRVWVSEDFLRCQGLKGVDEVALRLEAGEDGQGKAKELRFDADGCVELAGLRSATFALVGPGGSECRGSGGGPLRVHFPGDYAVSGSGLLSPARGRPRGRG